MQDGFHPTPTSDFAHLVLPAAIWGEKEGTYTNSERRVSKVNPASSRRPAKPAPTSTSSSRLQRRWVSATSFTPAGKPRTTHSRSGSASPLAACATTSTFTWQQIEDQGGIQWGGDRLYRRRRLSHTRRPRHLHSVPCHPFTEQPNAEFNFILNTGRTVEHWHTRTKTSQVEMLNDMVPNAWLEMNPADAANLDLKPHDRVTVAPAAAASRNVELRITGIVAPGQVFMPFHFSETNSNLVTLGAFDPISREPNFKQCAVRIEKHRTPRSPTRLALTAPNEISSHCYHHADQTNPTRKPPENVMANYQSFSQVRTPAHPASRLSLLRLQFRRLGTERRDGAVHLRTVPPQPCPDRPDGLNSHTCRRVHALSARCHLSVHRPQKRRHRRDVSHHYRLLYGFFFVHTFNDVLAMGVLLGIAGASFGVALSLGSGWFPKQYKGLAMGIAGAGNSGTALAALFAPRLATHYGWQHVYGFAALSCCSPSAS